MSTALTTARFGWLTLAGIIGLEVVAPAALVGQPIAGSTDRAVIESYLSHQALLPLGLGMMVLTGLALAAILSAWRGTRISTRAATVSLTIGMALLSGATRTAWVFEGLFAAGSIAVVVGRVCTPAILYNRLTRNLIASAGV